MPIIYETDEDKYYDKEDIKKYKKGSQSGIESRESGLFLAGTKNGNGIYLPTRKYDVEGEGIIDAIINAGKTVIEGISNNASTIGNIASSLGNVASAVKSIREAHEIKEAAAPIKKNKNLEEWKLKNRETLDRIAGEGFKII